MKNLSEIRNDYLKGTLSEKDMLSTPFAQFEKWLDEAIALNITEVNAVSLATVSPDGRPSLRIVLLKEVDERGFIFCSNYHSDKGQMLAINPFAALTFFWPSLERQVRIEGAVEKVSPEESDTYFDSRPREARIGAWVSEQSHEIESREELDKKMEELTARYTNDNEPILRPPHWGGYRLIPESIEFWQGRNNRLHDRLKYIRTGEGWKLVRLAP